MPSFAKDTSGHTHYGLRICGNFLCNVRFVPTFDIRQKYCSDRCSKSAHRQRREVREQNRLRAEGLTPRVTTYTKMEPKTIIPPIGKTYMYTCTCCGHGYRALRSLGETANCPQIRHGAFGLRNCPGPMIYQPDRKERRTDTVLGHYHIIPEFGNTTSADRYENGYIPQDPHTHHVSDFKTTNVSYDRIPYVHCELQPTNQRRKEMYEKEIKQFQDWIIEEEKGLESDMDDARPIQRALAVAEHRVEKLKGYLGSLEEASQIRRDKIRIFESAIQGFKDR